MAGFALSRAASRRAARQVRGSLGDRVRRRGRLSRRTEGLRDPREECLVRARIRGRATGRRHRDPAQGGWKHHRRSHRQGCARRQPASPGGERHLGPPRFIDAAQKLTDYANGTTVNVEARRWRRAQHRPGQRARRARSSVYVTRRGRATLDGLTAEAATSAARYPGPRSSSMVESAPSTRVRRLTANAVSRYAAYALDSGLGSPRGAVVGEGRTPIRSRGFASRASMLGRAAWVPHQRRAIEFSSNSSKIEALVRFLAGRSAAASKRRLAPPRLGPPPRSTWALSVGECWTAPARLS